MLATQCLKMLFHPLHGLPYLLQDLVQCLGVTALQNVQHTLHIAVDTITIQLLEN